jgi:hypothetical protein
MRRTLFKQGTEMMAVPPGFRMRRISLRTSLGPSVQCSITPRLMIPADLESPKSICAALPFITRMSGHLLFANATASSPSSSPMTS